MILLQLNLEIQLTIEISGKMEQQYFCHVGTIIR